MKNKKLLIFTFLIMFALPYIGSYLKWGGAPPGYGLFPAQKVEDDPGFNLTIFILFSIAELIVYLFLLFPRLFGCKGGVKQTPPVQKPAVVAYPKWFYWGMGIMLVSWLFMWGRFKGVYPLEHYTFVPLWWGFILALDGIVYKRYGGRSLIATRPTTMKLLAVASSGSWFVFEYFNFFVLANWYYPNNKIFTNFGNISWQLMSYTTVLPAVFEWYFILRSFKVMRDRYTNGPRINFSRPVLYCLMIVGLALMGLMGYFPYPLFWVLWISLIPGIVPAMALSGFWTPFMPVGKKGDYSALALIGIATLINGFFWELWNFGSEWFHHSVPTNPNYWKYSVPYVDVFHIFSEMPLLGYCGYVLFGVVCYVLWVTLAHICGFNPSLSLDAPDDRSVMHAPEQIPAASFQEQS